MGKVRAFRERWWWLGMDGVVCMDFGPNVWFYAKFMGRENMSLAG